MSLQIFILRALQFSYFATQSVLTPYLPLYFQHKGFTSFEIGILMMIGPFVAILAQPMWGYLSDRFQTVKKIILGLWLMTILSSIGLFHAHGFGFTFVFALLLYFFMIPSVPLLDSITIRSALQAGKSYGSIRLWGSLGFTLAALLSGFMLGWIGGIEHIRYIYWFLWILPFGFLYFLKDLQAGGTRLTFESLRTVVGNKMFLWFLFMVFIIMIPHRMNDSLLGLHMIDLGASDKMVSWAWALAAISEVPTFALLSRYMHRYHELALLCAVSVLYTIRWVLFSVVTDPWVLLFLQVFHCITFAAFWIVAVNYAVRLVPERFRSTGQSLLSAVFLGLAGITGGTVGGWLNGHWGGSAMYTFGAVLAFVSSVLFFSTHVYYRRQESRSNA